MALAHALLVGATGCNWAFGLDPTQTWDAGDAAPDSPPGVKTTLVWGAVTTDGMGTPDATITYAGIGIEPTRPEVPVVKVGPLDATVGPLVEVSYSTADGTFEIPYTLRDAPHRIVYTVPGDPAPHEVQWSETGAFLVVPRYLRMDAPLVPAGSGFTITPTGTGPGRKIEMVHTSGAFTLNDNSAAFDASTMTSVTLSYSEKARPLTKPLGAFESAKGDWVLVTDYKPRGGGITSVSGWALATNVDLSGSITVPAPQPAWHITDRPLSTGACPGANCFPTTSPGNAESRLDALGPLVVQSTHFQRIRYGIVPTTELPPYLPGPAPDFVEQPTLMYFGEASPIVTSMDVADPSTMLTGYPRVVSTLLYAYRTSHGVNLISSMQEAVKDLTSIQSVTWRAPLAKAIMLGSTSLSGADDTPFTATTGQITLVFTPDNSNAHDWIITISELANSTLTPVRVYHVTAPTAKIDASLLETGKTYEVTITSRVGLPMASQGDYRVVSWPFSTSTTAAATFVVQ